MKKLLWLWAAALAACGIAMLTGCARFGTIQKDYSYDPTGKLIRKISTRAASHTLFEAKSSLANWQASQTDKTQSAKVGGLNQEATATNLAPLMESIMKGVMEGAIKGAKGTP